ncbi:MAG: hypothetical protein AAB649_00100, partial [Patescibacteria group bacterium]
FVSCNLFIHEIQCIYASIVYIFDLGGLVGNLAIPGFTSFLEEHVHYLDRPRNSLPELHVISSIQD